MKKGEKKIVFLLTNRKHSGVLKRVESFIESGYDVEIYGFDRGFGKEVASLKDIPIVDLGLVENGKSYWGKLLNAHHIFKNIFRKNSSSTIYYVFSFDFALICLISRKKYIYEIRDLVYGYFSSSIIVNIFKNIDKILIKLSLLTVVLSEGFVEFLYGKKRRENVIVQPNKIHFSFKGKARPVLEFETKNEIVFGFIGALRFPNTIMRFARIIGERFPNHKFLFFGDGIPEYKKMVEELVEKYQNIHFYGSFKNPDDLSSIYSKVDVSLSCYDSDFVNVQYAEPNKLYESIYFYTPIIVSTKTFLGDKVNKLNVGFVIDATLDDEIIKYVNNLSFEEINKIKNNMSTFDAVNLIDDRANVIISRVNQFYNNEK
ncbi:glycosyltransferase [Labilibaculum sp.]|uniref:glycosyltransferase n=1 Tax=Labilibaculum sp. TaxID=2060723 RepID=UPI002AA8914B|nr:glycosyltransferase [Labilibaculum sp.]